MQANVLAMLCIMYYGIYTNEANRFTAHFAHSFAVFYVKVPCALALHFVLYPEVSKGMNLMKLANQQSGLFVEQGDKIAFILGFNQVALALICEVLNIYMLTFQHTIEHCIIHFVAFEVIVELSGMYFESLMNNSLKQVVHHPPKMEVKGKEIKWEKRTLFHKIARIIYKIIRCSYVSVNFYFVPYSVIFWQWMVEVKKGKAAH